MDKYTIHDTLKKYKTDLEEKGYLVFAVTLKGSQNYNLDDDKSDIDAVAVILPEPHKLTIKTPGKEYVYPEGIVTVMDIFAFSKSMFRGHPNFLELAHSKYIVGDKDGLSYFRQFKVNPKVVHGLVINKNQEVKKLLNKKLLSEEQMIKICKNIHHIARLTIASDNLIYFEGKTRNYLMSIKRNFDFAVKEYHEHINSWCSLTQSNITNNFTQTETDWKYIDSIYLTNLEKKNVMTF